ncbi:MAG: iron chelate uptake ABC transporter family permease subunit [Candidatus Bathyarchaeia archaeon]
MPRTLRRHVEMLTSSRNIIPPILLALFIIVILTSLSFGYSKVPLNVVLKALLKSMPLIGDSIDLTGLDSRDLIIITDIRLPRVLAGALVGSGLAISGAIFQGVFRNPMADPYVIGVSSGAALGASLAIIFGVGYSVFGVNSTSIMAFIAATATVMAVYNLGKVGRHAPVVTLLLSGVAVSIFLSSIVSLIQVFSGWEMHRLVYWMMGGFSYIEWKDVLGVLPLILLGALITYFYSRDLNVMTLGDEEAQHLGVNVETSRRVLLGLGSLMTAAAVSIGGLIGFVGLVIPHLSRILVGPDHRTLLPSSFLSGGMFLVCCDTLARTASTSYELPVGIITAMSGGPFFIYMLRKSRGKYSM